MVASLRASFHKYSITCNPEHLEQSRPVAKYQAQGGPAAWLSLYRTAWSRAVDMVWYFGRVRHRGMACAKAGIHNDSGLGLRR